MGQRPVIKAFYDLTLDELYAILQARIEVFAVEQDCAYQDLDGYDEKSFHLWIPHNEKIGAYCRILPAGVKYPEWSIGRVITTAQARGKGLGHQLNKAAIEFIESQKGDGIRISAQAHLQKFYATHGFKTVSEEYLEDNIPHVEMLWGKNYESEKA